MSFTYSFSTIEIMNLFKFVSVVMVIRKKRLYKIIINYQGMVQKVLKSLSKSLYRVL